MYGGAPGFGTRHCAVQAGVAAPQDEAAAAAVIARKGLRRSGETP